MNVAKSAVVGALAALALAGCGGSTRSDQPGRVKVVFCTTVSMPDCAANATVAQEEAVGRALRHSPHVVKAVYVSKAAGLKRFTKINPGLPTSQLPANPLPDEWVVTVDSDRNEAKVGKAICAAHYPGIERCAAGSSVGEIGGVIWGSPLADRIRHLG